MITDTPASGTGRTGVGRPVVGWVGLGDQGLPMATAIAQAGFPLHAWARRPTSLAGLSDVEHVRHDDLQALAAASDVVGLCVGTDDDVLALVTGGLLAGLRPGSVLVNHGTGTPGNAVRFAELCSAAGVDVLDVPVSGGRPAAVERRLTTMVGGPPTAVDRCRPVFASFSSHIVHVGGPGAGQTVKLFNNALMVMNQAPIADIFELAEQLGTDPVGLFEVLKLGSAGSTVLSLLNTMITTDTVEHLAQVEALDVELFDTALHEGGVDAAAVTARGLSGARRLPDVVRLLNP